MSSIQRLLDIMSALRNPASGCPWDLEQDFASIAPYTIEEAYEVADAIARDDMEELVDELGDLLFQVVFHAQMARERGAFDFSDVVTAICDKMVRRHPHVFGDERVETSSEQTRAWQAHKAAERATGDSGRPSSILDTLNRGRPALQRARDLQESASQHGFDWSHATEVMPKVREEIAELETCLERNEHRERAAEELGDLLFTCVNLARHLGCDAESALRQANLKFEHRFRYVEQRLSDEKRSLDEASLEEMDALWEEGKKRNA